MSIQGSINQAATTITGAAVGKSILSSEKRNKEETTRENKFNKAGDNILAEAAVKAKEAGKGKQFEKNLPRMEAVVSRYKRTADLERIGTKARIEKAGGERSQEGSKLETEGQARSSANKEKLAGDLEYYYNRSSYSKSMKRAKEQSESMINQSENRKKFIESIMEKDSPLYSDLMKRIGGNE